MTDLTCDVCVIGAGSGGLSVAAGASQMGADVILLEDHKMGGDCLNYGCVPSKALIASGKLAYAQEHSAAYGVANAAPQVNYAAAKDHVQDVIAQIEPVDSQERFEGFGVHVIREFGHFISPTEVQAGDHVITARRVVIATGSSPLVPPIDGLDSVPYLTNETLWDLRERPEHLLIIGGGPIGMEMAQAHRRLGSKVTVIEGAKALGKDDPEMAAVVLEKLRDEGIEIVEDALAQRIDGGDGSVTVHTKDGRSYSGSHLLVAVGRKTNMDKLNLDAAGIETPRTGVKVDAAMKTTTPKVYAIGDAAGGLQFTHVAGYHAGVIIRSALFGLPAKQRTDHIPWATYTDPELAQVGMTEAEARKTHGNALEVAEVMSALTAPKNSRLVDLTLALGAELMVLSGYDTAPEVAAVKLRDTLTSGAAREKFDALIAALGGPQGFSENWQQPLPEANVIREIPAPQAGKIAALDGHTIGMGVVHMGGGRLREGDRIDGREFVRRPLFGQRAEIGRGGELAFGQAINAIILKHVAHVHIAAHRVCHLPKADRQAVAIARNANCRQITIGRQSASGKRRHPAMHRIGAMRFIHEIARRLGRTANAGNLQSPVRRNSQFITGADNGGGDAVMAAASAQGRHVAFVIGAGMAKRI